MRKAYSILERQQALVRHLQECNLQETHPDTLVSVSEQLLRAIEGLRLCTSSGAMQDAVSEEILMTKGVV